MDSTDTRKKNEEKVLKFMSKAIEQKTDIICLSESFVYWGKEISQRICCFNDIQKYQDFAKKNKVNIVLGSVSLSNENTDKTTNTCFVINRNGQIVHRYDKKYMYKVNKKNLIKDESKGTIPR